MAEANKPATKPDWAWEHEDAREQKRLEAELAKLEAEAEQIRVDTRLKTAEADKQELYVEGGRLDLADKKRQYDELMADNVFHRIFRFNAQVSDKSVESCMRTIDTWRRIYPGEPITIIFSSPGGDVVSGMALWDYLQEVRADGVHLTTVAQGYAASMAGILLQAGDKRVIGKESYILIHEISAGMMGSFGELQDRMKWMKKVQERILDIFATRASAITGKGFRETRRYFEKEWTRTDWWIDSEEALRLGLVDEVK